MADNRQFLVRAANLQDVPEMCTLLADLFTVETDFHPDPARQTRALQQLITASEADQPAACRVWIAEYAGKLIGMCSLQVTISTAEGGEVGWIEDVIVHADFRHQGIGRAMLERVESWSQERGLLRLQLLADQHNQPAQRFYRLNGWKETRLQAYFRHFAC